MYILIDVGGTNTRVAVTEDRQTFKDPIIFRTPQNFDEWFSIVIEHIANLSGGSHITAIVVGMAGTFINDNSTLHVSPHLPEWNGINLREKLGGWFNCTVAIENDTALVGLGEAVYGSGKGQDIVVYITISTGVGGIRIVHEKIDHNKFGFEIGHQIINKDKEMEYYLAGSSHEKRFGMPSKEIKDADFWNEVNYYAGVLIANTTMYWSPSCIVIGGPVARDISIEDAKATATKFCYMYAQMPLILRSSLGDLGGIYGAMALSRTQ